VSPATYDGRMSTAEVSRQRADTVPSGKALALAWTAVLALAFVPYSGRWLILAVALPLLAVVVFYRAGGVGRYGAALARPANGWWRCLGQAAALSVALWAASAFLVHPLSALLFDQPKDLSLFDPIRGSPGNLALFLTFMWATAAFGEEFVWRGFLLRTAGTWLEGRIRLPWFWAVAACALIWALTHAYQGPRGVVERLVGGSLLGAIYASNDRSSIWLVVFVHGLGNTLAFVAIYFDAYQTLYPFA
jgi:CAAX protease family protein